MHRPFFAAALGALLLLGPALPLRAQARRGASAQLRYLGSLSDQVSRGARVAPDGHQDGRFRLVLESETFRRIAHVLLRSCDPRGVLTGRAAWDTDGKRLWVVGMFRGGRALSVGSGKPFDGLKGRVVYDLYASQPVGGFKPGEHYCAYVTFDGGMGVAARAAITAPVRASLRWVGTDKDKVGRGQRDKPDGVADGHFVLRLQPGKRRVQLTGLTLTALGANGKPVTGQRWDTRKNQIWILGVERGGRRLNWGDRPLKDSAAGSVDYDLYAAAKGAFQDGARYRVVAQFADGAPAAAVVSVKRSLPAAARLVYAGLDADKLGAASPSGPDGKPDGHFRLTITAPTPRRITNVVVRAVWPGGAAVQGQVWDTQPQGYRMVAVYQKGRLLNAGDRGLSARIQGEAQYDLYVHNTGWVRPLQRFQAEVVFEGGDRVFGEAKVIQRAVTGPVTLGLQYQGFTADRVGTGARGGPDGQRDARFALTLDTGGRQLTVNRVELSVSDAQGRTWKKTWDTQPGGHWILGVERDGKRLNPTDRPVQQSVTGRVTYTLWAANDFWKDPRTGQLRTYFSRRGYFTVRIFPVGHPMVQQTIRLP